ncbi:MAG: hypothetical protein N3B21_13950 [Clostridia bacterium]|nr:hypothetical protein [Clostridia bacterium]
MSDERGFGFFFGNNWVIWIIIILIILCVCCNPGYGGGYDNCK